MNTIAATGKFPKRVLLWKTLSLKNVFSDIISGEDIKNHVFIILFVITEIKMMQLQLLKGRKKLKNFLKKTCLLLDQ